MKGIVVIPTYNEAKNIVNIVSEVLKQGENIDVLVVDDNSPDGTSKIVKDSFFGNKRVFVLDREKKSGLGRAYIDGFKWAMQNKEYEFFCEMDADFSHDPNELPLLLKAIEEGADVVCGSRYYHGVRVLNWDLKRLLLSIGGNTYARIATGVNLTDLTGGYNCFTRKALEVINLDTITSNGYSFQIEMKATAVYKKLKVVEVPIVFRDRYVGETKMSGGIINEALLKCWTIRFKKR